MLTTVDNPYDPSTNFDAWYAFDEAAGYHTSAFLARVVKSSHELSEPDQELAIETAIQEIARENVLGIYRLVDATDSDESQDIEVPVTP